MAKKKWQNAEILELGIESTKVKGGDGQNKSHKCQYCNQTFDKEWIVKLHEFICSNTPASPGFGPEGNVTPGLDAAPIS